jgi:hypothetical protein
MRRSRGGTAGYDRSAGGAPKFEKRVHHVVPRAWQEKFAAPGQIGR